MTGLDPASWHEFALGQLGASAALLGLVFVGISINLRNVLSSRRLVNRAAEAVLLLASILLASTAVLVPGQPNRALGVELAVLGMSTLAAVSVLQRPMGAPAVAAGGPGIDAGDATELRVAHVLRRVLGAGACLLVLVAGATVLADGGGGLYWWVGAVVLAYAGALLSAWVLMIEILR